jgi:GT2 family glycosyltransferase
MPGKPKIAIVILNWNGKKLFDTFLPSVIRNSKGPDIKLIIADNGSTDGSVDLLKKNYPEVTLIELHENYGFAEGYNRALKNIKADYYVLLNSDVEVTPGWLDAGIKPFEKDENTAVVQPKILNYKKSYKFEYAGAAGGFIDKFGYPFCRGRILNKMEPDVGQYNKPAPIFWASGACMFIKADIYRESGGFDGDFWAHMEEIDLCWRLKNKGYKILYEPSCVVFHLGGGTLPYNSPKKVYLNFRNNLFMLFKNLPRNKFNKIFFARLILDFIAAIKFLLGFHFESFKSVVKAHISFYNNLKKFRRKRKELNVGVKISDHKEIYPKSIMWKFFIQKKYRFSELNFDPKNEQ